MNKRALAIAYAQSLTWVALFMALTSAEANIVELLLVDFVHGNPHRTQENAIFMMIAFTPLLGVVAIIETYLVFTLPQLFQAASIGFLYPKFGDRARFLALASLPLTAVLAWYCYDYLTPSDLCVAGSCTEDFRGGLTGLRYLAILLIQMPIALFSVLHCEARVRGRSKMPILLAALTVALIAGAVRGYLLARVQYQFL